MSKDYYQTLGVSKTATEAEIKKAYKKLARKYHPDVSKEADSEAKFKEINEAAGVLLDKEKRSNFDTYGSEGPQGFGGGSSQGFNPGDFGINLDDIFEQFGFGGGGGFGGRSSRTQQKDTRIQTQTTISLEDVYFGVKKDISVTRDVSCDTCEGIGTKKPEDVKTCSTCNGSGVVIEVQRSFLGAMRTQRACSTCNGTGSTISNPCSTCSGTGAKSKNETFSVTIPKGVMDGVTLRLSGKGSFDPKTKQFGDLYVHISVRNTTEYEVEDSDLYKLLKINFVQAILGDEIEFKHFDKTLSVKIPAGTQSGSVLRLKGKGLPLFNQSSGHGDLFLKVEVEIPKKTTTKQKEILLNYAKTLKDKSLVDRLKGFFK